MVLDLCGLFSRGNIFLGTNGINGLKPFITKCGVDVCMGPWKENEIL